MRSAAVWRQRVRAWRASGETAAQFAEGKGFAEATLRWWAWKLRGKVAPPAPAEPIALLRVVRSGDAGSPAELPRRASPIEIELGRARVSVGAGADRGALRDVLEVLAAIDRERGR